MRLHSPMSTRRESENFVIAENNRNTDISIEVGTITQVILHHPQESEDSPLMGSSGDNFTDHEAKHIEDVNEEMKSHHDRRSESIESDDSPFLEPESGKSKGRRGK